MSPRPSSAGLLALGIMALVLSGAAETAAQAQAQGEKVVSLAPSRFRGVSAPNALYGPITLANGTDAPYAAEAVPVLLGQLRDSGDFVVRDDAGSRREAALLLSGSKKSFDLPPTSKQSVLVRAGEVGPEEGIYAGMLFVATPSGEGQIQETLRLNALFLLDPRRANIDLAPAPVVAAQTGPGQISLIVPVKNTGNVYTPIGGQISVYRGHQKVAQVPLIHRNGLPGSLLDIPGPVKARLAAGVYTLRGTIRSRDKEFPAHGTMRLFGPNQTATPGAHIVQFDQPAAYRGEPVELHATFKNTGNVPLAPTAAVRVGLLGADAKLKPLATSTLSSERVGPGQTGDITGSVRLPEGDQFQVVLTLTDHGRVLDTASLGVGVVERPPRGFPWWILVVAVVLVLVAVSIVARRRRRAARSPTTTTQGSGAAPVPLSEPLAQASDTTKGAATVDINVATEAELLGIPGIGPKAASRIIEHRDEYGRFESVDALSAVEGFNADRVEKLRLHLRA
jgi:competence ComEA-like helix-hairpin-helix protein